jgi:hypothetical protein
VGKVLKFPTKPGSKLIEPSAETVNTPYSHVYQMAMAARADPNHRHIFTNDQERRGGPAMCLMCLRTVQLPKESQS